MTIVRSQLLLAITAGFGLTFAFCGCGDNSHPPEEVACVDQCLLTCPECPLPPPDEPDKECYFECEMQKVCRTTGGHHDRDCKWVWRCTEVCDCQE